MRSLSPRVFFFVIFAFSFNDTTILGSPTNKSEPLDTTSRSPKPDISSTIAGDSSMRSASPATDAAEESEETEEPADAKGEESAASTASTPATTEVEEVTVSAGHDVSMAGVKVENNGEINFRIAGPNPATPGTVAPLVKDTAEDAADGEESPNVADGENAMTISFESRKTLPAATVMNPSEQGKSLSDDVISHDPEQRILKTMHDSQDLPSTRSYNQMIRKITSSIALSMDARHFPRERYYFDGYAFPEDYSTPPYSVYNHIEPSFYPRYNPVRMRPGMHPHFTPNRDYYYENFNKFPFSYTSQLFYPNMGRQNQGNHFLNHNNIRYRRSIPNNFDKFIHFRKQTTNFNDTLADNIFKSRS